MDRHGVSCDYCAGVRDAEAVEHTTIHSGGAGYDFVVASCHIPSLNCVASKALWVFPWCGLGIEAHRDVQAIRDTIVAVTGQTLPDPMREPELMAHGQVKLTDAALLLDNLDQLHIHDSPSISEQPVTMEGYGMAYGMLSYTCVSLSCSPSFPTPPITGILSKCFCMGNVVPRTYITQAGFASAHWAVRQPVPHLRCTTCAADMRLCDFCTMKEADNIVIETAGSYSTLIESCVLTRLTCTGIVCCAEHLSAVDCCKAAH